MKSTFATALIFVPFIPLFISCNNKQPLKPNYSNIGGYVIGNENCYADSTKDYVNTRDTGGLVMSVL